MVNDHTMDQLREGQMSGLPKNERLMTNRAIFNRGGGMIYSPPRMDMQFPAQEIFKYRI